MDTWIDGASLGRTNLPPEKVPWTAIRTLFGQCIYGGKIDNEFDQRLLNSFLANLFTERSFEPDFMLVEAGQGSAGIHMPEGIRRDQFLAWVEQQLTELQQPSWLGLPNNAEKVLLTNRGSDLLAKLLRMQLLEDDDDDVAYNDEQEKGAATAKKTRSGSLDSSARPAWMVALQNSAANWLKLVPQSLQTLKRTKENIRDPLYRYFEREVNVGAQLLGVIRRDLADIVQICRGEKKQTNLHRQMISELAKGGVPSHWKGRYTAPPGATVIQWITDFNERVDQLARVSKACSQGGPAALKALVVWLGGLFNPEAYITATRQYVAQANGWSLEELSLAVTIRPTPADPSAAPQLDECSFALSSLKLQGAECCAQNASTLQLSMNIFSDLPLTLLTWTKATGDDEPRSAAVVTLPVYLNSSRTELLFTVDLEAVDAKQAQCFYERGVAILCNFSLLG